ncbi:MAG: hypothetical protein JSS89_07075 [Bacteroidetes bacterium]|nr:hypothetical protein [Bacteroidota bacterium]
MPRRHAVAFFSCTILFLLSVLPAASQPYIRSITVDRRDVFDPRHSDWFFGADWANAIHTLTREYYVEDELLFEEGDELDTVSIMETERILRKTGLFSLVRVKIDTVSEDSVDITLLTQDRWSFRPAVLFGTGGGASNIGVKIEEGNVAGTGTDALLSGVYKTENDIGWEGMASVGQRRLFRTEIGLYASILANRIKTEQSVTFIKQFRTMATPTSWSVALQNSFGSDFIYDRGVPTSLAPFHLQRASAWHAWAYGERDRLFFTVFGSIEDIQRASPNLRQAFDNTGRVLVAFSSIRQEYKRSVGLNGFETEDVQARGAWGSAILGRIFSLGKDGESMWYVGGMAEQSGYVGKDVYLFGRLGAGSGFGEGQAKYTAMEILGIGHARLTDQLVLAGRFRQNTAWNWAAFRQLILDNEAGLRGYPVNQLVGDNRIVANCELRYFPGWKWWAFGFSGVAFYDFGSVWNQGTALSAMRFHHSIGLGFRVHNLKSSGADAIFRFDFAFNLDENRFAGLVFSTNQLFSAFGSHQYKVPDMFGREIDLQ